MRHRRDLDDDLDNLFDRDEAERRRLERAREREDMIENARVLAEADAKAEALRAVRARESMQRANASALRRGYREAGVEPVHVLEDGTPRVSLPMLLRLGWKIGSDGDGKYLVKPPPEPKREVQSRKPVKNTGVG